jgi:hypothetical protein
LSPRFRKDERMTFADLGVSLDGFIAGPNRGPENALGDGGHRIHKWVYAVEATASASRFRAAAQPRP